MTTSTVAGRRIVTVRREEGGRKEGRKEGREGGL
jgi:hypothetical protein